MWASFTQAFPVRLLSCLVLISTGFFCQRIQDKVFMISSAWRGYCPSATTATFTLPVKSVKECALECSLASQCVVSSFYTSNATCCIYYFVPQKVDHDDDCTLMIDREALVGSTEMTIKSCNNTQVDERNSLKLTIATKAICFSISGLPVQPSIVVDLGEGPVPLPSANNWIIMMQRFDGSVSFDRNWAEYKNGFGDIGRGEFWLGNEIVHRLTNKTGTKYILRLEVRLTKTGEWFSTDYSTFSLDSESSFYTIHVSAPCGGAGDSLTNSSYGSTKYLNGMNFTTRDSDNDLKSGGGNCAYTYSCGWWFNNCAIGCLTCKQSTSFVWWSLKGPDSDGMLSEARMMIKSK